MAPSCFLLTILHTWPQQEGVRMPIIFIVCCAGYSGEAECGWLPWQKLTTPRTWEPCKWTRQSVILSRQQVVPVAMNQAMQHNTVFVPDHTQRWSDSGGFNMIIHINNDIKLKRFKHNLYIYVYVHWCHDGLFRKSINCNIYNYFPKELGGR